MTRIVALQLASALCDLAGNLARATAALTDRRGGRGAARAAGCQRRGGACGRAARGRNGWARAGRDRRRKVHLWNREKELFTPTPCRRSSSHGRIGVMICFDLGVPAPSGAAGADLLAVPTNWPALGPRPPATGRPRSVSDRGMNRMAIAFADRRRRARRRLDRRHGNRLGRGPADRLGRVRRRWPTSTAASRDKGWGELVDLFGDRRPDLYGGLASTDRSSPAQPRSPATTADGRSGRVERSSEPRAELVRRARGRRWSGGGVPG